MMKWDPMCTFADEFGLNFIKNKIFSLAENTLNWRSRQCYVYTTLCATNVYDNFRVWMVYILFSCENGNVHCFTVVVAVADDFISLSAFN